MNCMALQLGTEVVLVDCGVTFPNPSLGANLIHPAFDALRAPGVALRGIVLTHGHEDHIGAVPYFLREFPVPVWGPSYALSLLEDKLSEHELLDDTTMHRVKTGEPFDVGPFCFETIRVTHSTADATALAIDTPEGLIVHSGDFKIDETPTDGEQFDHAKFKALGESGVSLLLSDSTNALVDGVAGSEAAVGQALADQIKNAPAAVIVTVFASNVHRLSSLVEAAKRTDRKILALGRSVRRHLEVSQHEGYLDNLEALLVSPKAARKLPRDQLLVVATGSQGEGNAALRRLAEDRHRDFAIQPGDQVVFSSRIIPGHEQKVFGLVNSLLRKGTEVVFGKQAKGLHVSGHACRSEQADLISLVQPGTFVPVHGTLMHLQAHGELARSLGVPDVHVVENGTVLALRDGKVSVEGHVPSGRVHVDNNFEEVLGPTLSERARMADGGSVTAVLSSDGAGTWTGRVRVLSTGALADPDDEALIADAERFVSRSLKGNARSRGAELEAAAQQALERFFRRELGQRPVCTGVLAP